MPSAILEVYVKATGFEPTTTSSVNERPTIISFTNLVVVGSNPVAASHVSGQNLLKNSRPAKRLSYKQPNVDEDVGRLLNEKSE